MLSPDMAFALSAAGVAGCVWELVQPRWVVPGVAGLGAAAAGAYWLWRDRPSSFGLILIGLWLVLFAGTLWMDRLAARLSAVTLASAVLSAGFILLFPAPLRILPVLAMPVCISFSLGGVWLLRTAVLGHLRKR